MALVASILSLAVAEILIAGMFLALGRGRSSAALRWWALAWLLDGVRHIAPLLSTSALSWSLSGVLLIVSGFALVAGALRWADRPLGRGWPVGAGATAALVFLAPLGGLGVDDLGPPVAIYLLVVRLRSAAALAWAAPGDKLLRGIAAVGLAVWGGMAIAHPFVSDSSDLRTWGFSTVTVLTLAVAFALMLAYFERRKAESERTESQIRSIFEGSGQNIAIYDRSGRVTRMNPSFASLFGGDDELSISGVVPDAGDRAAFFRATDFSARPVQRVRMNTAAGVVRDFDISVSRLPEDDLFMVFAFDVTKQVLLERELEDARKLEALGRVATGIAHDLNNILNVISTYVSLGRISGDPHEAFVGIREATRRGERLTQKLRTIGPGTTVRLRPIRVDEVVREVGAGFGPVLGSEVDLRLEVPEDPGMVARADPSQLEQILFNLIANARESMPDGGPIEVRVSRSAESARILLEVDDAGVGIAVEDRQAVFDPFYSTKPGRAGLGLAAVRNIVQDRRWNVEITDRPGGGTRFSVEIPTLADGVESSNPELDSGWRGRVLLVDDNLPLVRVTARTLERDGFEAQAVDKPAEVLERLEHERYDALVTDLFMPEMDGVELAERAWERHPDLRVVLITGYSTEEVPDDPRLIVLAKPYSEEALRDALMDGRDSMEVLDES